LRTTCSKSTLILTCCRFSLKPKLILVNYSSLVIIHLIMRRFWTIIQAGILWISIFPISSWKKVSSKCYLKVLGGITILIGSTNINSTGILNKIGSIDISSICSIIFKLVDVINFISWSNQIHIKITCYGSYWK